ncbi:MAG: hypothetical protein ACSLE6_09885 [Mycobacterium sp.]
MADNPAEEGRSPGWQVLAGLTVGSQLLITYFIVGPAAPAVPLLLALATAFPRNSRNFAVGACAAGVAGFVFILLFAMLFRAVEHAT